MNTSRILALAPLQIVQAIVGFGAIAAFTRLMSAEEFGRYALALTISMTAHTLLFTWAEAAAFRFFASARVERRLPQHFATLIAIALVLSAGAAGLTALTLAFAGPGAETAAIVAFAAGAAILRFILRVARESDRAALRFSRYAALETAYLVIAFAAGIAFLFAFDFGAVAPFAGLLTAGAAIALFDAPFWLSAAKGGRASAQAALRYASYGAPLALALSLDLAIQSAARLVLASQSGEASLGAYAAAFGLARPLDVMFAGLGAAFGPLVFAAYEERGVEAAKGAARSGFALLAAIAIPACIGIAMLAEPFAALVVGPALRDQAALALPWLAFAGLFTGFSLHYFSEAFQLSQRTGVRAMIMLAPGALQIALTHWLANAWGAQGAAIAAAAAGLISMIALAVAGRRFFAMPLPLPALASVIAASGLMALALHVANPPATLLGFALGVALGGATYIGAAILFDVFGMRGIAFHLLRAARTAVLARTSHAA